MFTLTLGSTQHAACQVYVDDPVFAEDIAGVLSREGNKLTVYDREKAWAHIMDGANSADADKDAEFRDALTSLSRRVLTQGEK